ncbi:MAG: glycosyltransferase [Cyanobacteria bacterium J06650_10]
MKPKVLIHRNHLIRPSETFIQAQVENLKDFESLYVGLRIVPGLSLPREQVVTIPQVSLLQKQKAFIYQLCSRHSSFFREVSKASPSLIHAHFGPDGVKAMPLAANLNIPLIVTFHGYDITLEGFSAWYSSYSYFMYLTKRKKLKRISSKFIAVSNFIKDKLLQKGFPSDKIRVHYIGVDTQKFSSSLQQKREPIILFVGRLIAVKGCEYLIRAMSQVQQIFPSSQLVVLGDGPLKQKLEILSSQTLANYQFLGFQPLSVVKEWMARAKVFSVPSISDKNGHTEAFGTVFLEAQSMGLPVVSSLSGGIPEAVEHGKTGLLAPEKDATALAKYITMLLQDEQLWGRMSQNASGRVRSHFDIRQQTKKLENIYLEVLQERL